MGIVYQVEPDDWSFMLMLKKSVSYMQKKDKERYASAIDKEKNLFKETLAKVKTMPEDPRMQEAA